MSEKKLKVAEAENFTLGLDSFHTLKLENIKLKDRLAKAQDVLEDICHHVGKDCFATCKGDWSGTACLTYRIFDAMNGGQPPKGDSCTKGEDTK